MDPNAESGTSLVLAHIYKIDVNIYKIDMYKNMGQSDS